MKREYPVNIDAVHRPFRLWHEQRKEQLRWRYYAFPRKAQIGALIEVKYECKVGQSIAVIDVRNGKLLGLYTRQLNSVTFHQEKTNGIKDAE